jgi:hypothetical protein
MCFFVIFDVKDFANPYTDNCVRLIHIFYTSNISTYTTCFNPKLGSPWRRGIVVIAYASRPEDPGFESRQGVRFLGLIHKHCSAVFKT